VVLSILMLGALALRLHVVWQRTSNVLDQEMELRRAGEEIGSEELADALRQGTFLPSPVRVPASPIGIAAADSALGERSPAKLLYGQAVVGVLAVPLTSLLARRVTGIILALVAAGIVALDDALIWHARGMFTEFSCGNARTSRGRLDPGQDLELAYRGICDGDLKEAGAPLEELV
jgi:hypothetical protein